MSGRSRNRSQVAAFDRQLLAVAKTRPACRLLMSIPGVGYVSALAFMGAIDVPERFARSRAVGAHLGLAPKQHQSGEVDRLGEISKCGDAYVRTVPGGGGELAPDPMPETIAAA